MKALSCGLRKYSICMKLSLGGSNWPLQNKLTRMYVTSMSDFVGLSRNVLNSSIPWYITIPRHANDTSTQKRRQNIDLAEDILMAPCALVSSAKSWSRSLKDGLFLAIVSSVRLEVISVSIFQVWTEDDLDLNSVLKEKKRSLFAQELPANNDVFSPVLRSEISKLTC